MTSSASVEFWSAADPEEASCELDDFPREINQGPTANLVLGQLVVCYGDSCEIYNDGAWEHLVQTMHSRQGHSSAEKEERILLIGGQDSRSTEWISVDGSPVQPGPFEVRHGARHCSLQISSDLIVVTGGFDTEEYVTEYQLTGDDATENLLTPMIQPRQQHACGAYQGVGDQQVTMMMMMMMMMTMMIMIMTMMTLMMTMVVLTTAVACNACGVYKGTVGQQVKRPCCRFALIPSS